MFRRQNAGPVILCGCEMWSHNLRDGYSFNALQKKVLRGT